jgi:uncharacterized membrane protein YdbT with pleckstrin-like domain
MVEVRKQVFTGLVPPQAGEAIVREIWPSVMAAPVPGAMVAATLGRILNLSIVGAPLAWLLLIPVYFSKVLPFLAKRYTLTNRRVMIQRGLLPKPTHEVPLADIDDIKIRPNVNSAFYRAADLDIIANGKVALTLHGVPDPETFKHAILNACQAWAPGKVKGPFIPAKEEK